MEIDELITKVVELSNGGNLKFEEYKYIVDLIQSKEKCNFLIFGVGHDSQLWEFVNSDNTYLESNMAWLNIIKPQITGATKFFVRYNTHMSQWQELLNGPTENLEMDLPDKIMNNKWDLIFVDAPEGIKEGRMKSIYMASVLATRDNADVVLHDCDRETEQAYCDKFLKPDNLVTELRKTRHYKL